MSRATVAAIILFIILPFTAPGSFAREKDLTSPILTCGVIGQLVQDAALALGPVVQQEPERLEPDSLPGRPALTGSRRTPLQVKRTLSKVKETKQQQSAHGGAFEPQAHRFSGEQMWGKADVTLVTAARSFDLKVTCTLPVTMWALYADDVQISSASVPNLTAFSFKGNELYTPPYKLVLNVIYMGIPNQIRVDLK